MKAVKVKELFGTIPEWTLVLLIIFLGVIL